MNISIVIPAKGHSQRVHNKNLYRINGKSLVYQACEKVLNCKSINSFYLDTEDEAIIKDCEDLTSQGLQIIQRPKELATNFIGANELMIYALHSIDHCDLLLQTFSTSPLITAKTIDTCIEQFLDSKDYDSFFTVTVQQEYLWNEDGKPINFSPVKLPNSFQLDKLYVETHGLYGIFTDTLLKTKTRIGYKPLLIPISLIEGMDINTEEDLEIIRRLSCYTAD